MPSACDATERHPVQEHFHNVEAASKAFCMQCGPNVWLTTLQRRTRSCICMACVDAPCLPCGFCILPHPCWRFHTPWQNSCLLIANSHAGLSSGFCGSDCFMCASFYSVSLGLSHLTCFVFTIWSVSTYHPFSAHPFFSCSPLFLHHFKFSLCTEWLLYCQASSFLQRCHYLTKEVKKLQAYTHLTFKHVKAKDRNKKLLQLWSFFFCQREPYTFVFDFPLFFSITKS